MGIQVNGRVSFPSTRLFHHHLLIFLQFHNCSRLSISTFSFTTFDKHQLSPETVTYSEFSSLTPQKYMLTHIRDYNYIQIRIWSSAIKRRKLVETFPFPAEFSVGVSAQGIKFYIVHSCGNLLIIVAFMSIRNEWNYPPALFLENQVIQNWLDEIFPFNAFWFYEVSKYFLNQ